MTILALRGPVAEGSAKHSLSLESEAALAGGLQPSRVLRAELGGSWSPGCALQDFPSFMAGAGVLDL